jgi:hypothetical protein
MEVGPTSDFTEPASVAGFFKRVQPTNFIETYLGFSPDHGDGTF